ncbi:MAG: hypothetical protein ABI980_13195 [Nitrospirota bacterium]
MKWQIRLHTFPKGNGEGTIEEHLNGEKFYSTLSEAHTAGFDFCRRFIDESLCRNPV